MNTLEIAWEIRFELDDDQYEKMNQIKHEQGRTWAGLFVAGVRELEGIDSSDERLDGLIRSCRTLFSQTRPRYA